MMDDETLKKFAKQLDAEPQEVVSRWRHRPDRIMDDVFRIRDVDSGEVVDLELFDVQRKLVHGYFYSDAGTVNAYKGRRIGYSFAVVACFLLEGMFYADSFYPLVSRSWSQAKNRIDDIASLINNAKINIPTEKMNSDEIVLWNGTTFKAYSSDADTSRGDDSARAVLMDEMAFMEDQKEALRAFGAFLALGENRKMVQVSTPNTKNDVFMQEHRRGTPEGENGVLSIKQPSFENASEIDIYTPLTEQDVTPVRDDMNVERIETDRMADPEGFGQEYLCRPVVDEYRFFDEETIQAAIDRGRSDDYALGLSAPKGSARRVMGVDIGINRDDTVLAVTDHYENTRKQRELIVADEKILRELGIRNPDRGNANHIAKLISHVYEEMDVDLVIMDKGGVGQTFDRIVQRELGRGYVGFDFSAKEDVADMMGDMNICLREGNISLYPSDRLYDEMAAIVKEKRDEYQRPKFQGKENSESGKDDAAIATCLSAFPPNSSSEPATEPSYREASNDGNRGAISQRNSKTEPTGGANFGASSINRNSRSRTNRYRGKRPRNR